MTQFFGVFCKKCGSYEIKIYVSPAKELLFECKKCEQAELFEGEETL